MFFFTNSPHQHYAIAHNQGQKQNGHQIEHLFPIGNPDPLFIGEGVHKSADSHSIRMLGLFHTTKWHHKGGASYV